LNFDRPTWHGLWALLKVFRSTFGRVSIGSESYERADTDASDVDDAVRRVQERGGFVQLVFGEGTDLLKQLQVFVSNDESPTPFIEITFFPDDWAVLSPVADRFSAWARNLRRVLEAARVYARYENSSWAQGDVGPTSGVFFAADG